MADVDLPLAQRIEVLQLEEGDVLAVTFDGPMHLAEARAIEAYVRARVPEHHVVVLDRNAELSVVRPAEGA